MELHNLKPAEGSTKKRNESGVDKVPVMGVHQPVVTKELNLVQVTNRNVVFRAVRCLCSVQSQNLVLKM